MTTHEIHAVAGGSAAGLLIHGARGSSTIPPEAPRFSIAPAPSNDGTVRLSGTFSFRDAPAVWEAAHRAVEACDWGDYADFDLSDVQSIDGGTLALLVAVGAELGERGVRSELVGARGRVSALVRLYGDELPPRPLRRPVADGVRARARRAARDAGGAIGFASDLVLGAVDVLRAPRKAYARETLSSMARAGLGAVPIVFAVGLLSGFVMASHGVAQRLGADVAASELVGRSLAREIAPLATGIVVGARTGAAYAAELGAMRVSDELDTLRTLGLGPMRLLVIPRTLALVLVMPALTLLADAAGWTGGLLAALRLDVTLDAYVSGTSRAIDLASIGTGLVKSAVFALSIGIIGCWQGFATAGGAAGVGRRTASAAVTILFAIAVLDAAFTLLPDRLR